MQYVKTFKYNLAIIYTALIHKQSYTFQQKQANTIIPEKIFK